ncbi:Bardet-Biedl syndrome 2 protein [Folsomia candida]|uniref:Bardet-Biedl syndrome 2 protein homolog n=1 Tax=Folsomia candida TaxID=158441 RepID=A0A226E1R1_FOLCA|nr:Bardet-Biedl syndrome 2 protein [Folsomia candida]
MSMGSTVLSIKIGHKILPGRVCIGLYDGKSPCLTCATYGERVCIEGQILQFSFSNILLLKLKKTHELIPGKSVDAVAEDITFLNINQPITCIAAGPMYRTSDRYYLFVGTQTNVFGYDVENNKDLFFKEVVDGVNCILTGCLSGVELGSGDSLAIAGGNCSLQGFDAEGTDVFWTVTGDNVGAIALLDYDGDGENEMVVGSDDFDIRVFKSDQIIGEASETDTISHIAPLKGSTFAYALTNGTIGVYERLQRLWRIKSKNHALAIVGFDFDGDGFPELVTGWSNGKMDIRNVKNGEVLFKDNFNHPLAGIFTVDINQDGKMHLICCDVEGEVRIYQPSSHDGRMLYISPNVEQEAIRELSIKKHHLLLELKNYDASGAMKSSTGSTTTDPSSRSRQREAGAIPTKTTLQTAFSINMGSDEKGAHIEITLSLNNDAQIRSALIFAEGIFQGECHVVHPKLEALQSKISVPLMPPKNVVVDLHIKAYVGFSDSEHFHVFEMTRQIPRFSMFAVCKDPNPQEITSFVRVPIQERPARLVMWINQNFLLAEEIDFKTGFSVSFISLRNHQELSFEVETSGTTIIRTNDMDLAGDITEAEYPDEITHLVRAVEEYQESNDRLGADISDQSGVIKTLLIRAEDARLIGDIKGMRKWYMQLHDANRNLINQHQIRCNMAENISESIKAVNQIIQKAARLRVGKPKANVITACRDALRVKNIEAISRIIKSGAT